MIPAGRGGFQTRPYKIAAACIGPVPLLRGVVGGLTAASLKVETLERVGVRHGDDVVARVDEVNVAGDAARKVREQIERGSADLVERYAAAERRVPLLEREQR